MDVYEIVAKARPEMEGTDDSIAAGRARLLAEIHTERRPARSRSVRRRWLIAGGLAGAAAATAGALVIGSLSSPGLEPTIDAQPTRQPGPTLAPSPEPTPEPTVGPLTPASAFGAAATGAISFTGLTVGPGQYLQQHVVLNEVVYHQPDPELGEYQADRSNALNAWGVRATYDSYAPQNVDDQWYYTSEGIVVTGLFGPDAGALSAAVGSGPSAPYFGEGPSPLWETPGGYTMASFLQAMPRDPQALLDWVRGKTEAVPADQDFTVGWAMIDLLTDYVLPNDARSALYGALGLLTGTEAIAESGTTVTVRFSAPTQNLSGGDAIMRRTVTFDTTTGLVLARSESLDTPSSLIPATLSDRSVSYTYTVVDQLP